MTRRRPGFERRGRSARRLALACAAVVVLAWVAPACKPSLDETVSVVSAPTVLAVRSDPAEAAPGASVTLTALYVDTAGPIANGSLRWDFCEAREPLAELGPVNTKCQQTSGSWFVPLGDGTPVTGTIPGDACSLFGPDVPTPVPGQPPGRPVDPDSTGGYYDPVRLLASGASTPVTIAEPRLACGPGAAPGDVGVDYAHRYHLNANPTVTSVVVVGSDGTTTPLVTSDNGTNPVQAGAHLALRLAWPTCPVTDVCGDGVCGPDETVTSCPADCTTPVGCSGAERFVVFDVASQALVDQRESMAIAWFATAGSFDSDRTGRNATDVATTSDNGWTAPSAQASVDALIHLWVVLRDDRGGLGWAEYVLEVS